MLTLSRYHEKYATTVERLVESKLAPAVACEAENYRTAASRMLTHSGLLARHQENRELTLHCQKRRR